MRLFIILFFLISISAKGQVTIEEFLDAAFDEPSIQAFDSQNNFLESNPYRLSVIRRMEFRTESNQLDPQRQDYALRLNPASPWELKRNNEYFQTYQEVLQLDRDRVLKESLKARYMAIIEWVYFTEIKNLKEEENAVTKKLVQILEAQRYSNFFNANDYIELKIEQVDKLIGLEEIYFDIENQRIQIESLYPTAKLKDIHWSFQNILAIEKIESIVERIDSIESATGEVAYRLKRIDLANSEWQLEKSNINVGYLQAQYQNFRKEQDRSPWNLALGVTIPIFNPNKGNMAKRKLEVFEAEGDLTEAKEEMKNGKIVMKAKIKSLINRYEEIQHEMESLKLDELSEVLLQIKERNPITVVRLENNVIKAKAIGARLKMEIYKAYIEYLTYAEIIQQQPIRNYLSNSLDTAN